MLPTLLASLLLSPVPTDDEPVKIPFKATENAIIVDAVLNGKNVSAMFDTGFGGDFVIQPGIDFGKPTGMMTLRDFVGESEAPTYKITSLKLGPLTLSPQDREIVSSDGGGDSWSYGTHVDGIMGLAVLKDFVFEIDMEHHQFIIFPKTHDITKTPTNSKTTLVKMLPIGTNSVELPVKTEEGKSLTLALDTGNAFYATTHTDVLARVGLWKEGSEAKFTYQSMVASGPVDSFSIVMNGMSIFGVPVDKSVWDIIDLPSGSSESDGTVGYQFLKNFNMTIDLGRRMVLLENFTGSHGGAERASTGITAFFVPSRKKMVVVSVAKQSPADVAGIKRGDNVLGVGSKEIGHMSPTAFRKLMEGESDSIVRIQVSRNGEFKTYDVKRAVMVNQTIKG